jgi:hypothetical protein
MMSQTFCWPLISLSVQTQTVIRCEEKVEKAACVSTVLAETSKRLLFLQKHCYKSETISAAANLRSKTEILQGNKH